jgi:hypothetical protein
MELVAGRKTFELRRDDRDFQSGDTLLLVEWDEASSRRTGFFLTATVGFVARPPLPFDPNGEGLAPGWVVMSLSGVKLYRVEETGG